MPLAESDYWRTISKKLYDGLILSRLSAASMIGVNKTMCRHEGASCDWHICWYCLVSVPIRLRPVTLMKPDLVDGRMCQVETQLPLRM